jgi:hypothetical protein
MAPKLNKTSLSTIALGAIAFFVVPYEGNDDKDRPNCQARIQVQSTTKHNHDSLCVL